MNKEIQAEYSRVISALTLDQPMCDRHAYKCALEASGAPAGRATLVAKLYEQCLRPTTVDYGKIPDSRGNLLKVKDYDVTAEAIDLLNKLMEGTSIPELKILNDYHDMLIRCRSDFEYGFKYNIEIIKVMYNNMVRALYELIDMCIASYAMYLREKNEKAPRIRALKPKDCLMMRSIKSYIAIYKNGEWAKLMKVFKDPKVAAAGENVIRLQLNESFTGTTKTAYEASLGELLDNVGYSLEHKPIGALSIILAPMIILLNALRIMSYFFISSSGKISSYLDRQAELLKTNMDTEIRRGADTNSEAMRKQKKMYDFFQSVSGFINAKILKMDELVKKEIMIDNRANYGRAEIVPVNQMQNSAFTFM